MRAYDPRPPHYLISVDLGIAPARTAIAVMEIHGVRPTVELHVRAISRPPLGTKTAAIIEETRALCDRLGEQLVRQYYRWADPDEPRWSYRSVLVDLTGSGLPALALFDHARVHTIPIWITNGIGFSHESRGYRVAKPDLISALSLLVEDGRVKVAAALTEAPTVLREFQTFQRTTPLGTPDERAVWRERPDDDLVLSLAMGAWYAQHGSHGSTQKLMGL
jgi:hypothetical protein